MSTEPPSWRTSLRTTSMPTPRPASWLTWSAVQAPVDGAAADRFAVQAGAVVGHFQHDFRTFAVQADGDLALLRLAGGAALFRCFQAMGHGVAQHVLQRRDHAVQDVAVQFAVGAFQGQVNLLAGVQARLADHPAQARHQAIERHHARAHQAILQFRTDARLLPPRSAADSFSARLSCCSVEKRSSSNGSNFWSAWSCSRW
ncbi:hypothetical protein G6F62_013317 [Rhizopus arrhizus]|nr:hypothetical protein G6F62_013317 [Rhizopus arrhizus]